MGLFLIFLCFVGSYQLFINRNRDRGENYYLCLIYLLNGIQGFNHLVTVVNLPPEIAALFFIHTIPIAFTLGPVLFFYIRKLLSPELTLSKKDWIHLIPALFFLINTLPYDFLPYNEKIEWIKAIKNNPTNMLDIPLLIGTSSIFFLARPISILFYIILSIRYVVKNFSQAKKRLSYYQQMFMARWIQMILITTSMIYVSNLIYTVNSIHTRNLSIVTSISIVAGLGLGFLCIQLFINPYILFGFGQIRYHASDSFLAKLYFIPQKTEEKFTKAWAIDIENTIIDHEETLAFLKKGYSIKNLSEELNIPLYQLNHYFKDIYNDSFSNWKNIKRIDYATKLILDGFLVSSTMENLSNICGYSSRSNFNDAFKMVRNQTIKSFLSTMK
jgi:AraC-like DNA-binding protein